MVGGAITKRTGTGCDLGPPEAQAEEEQAKVAMNSGYRVEDSVHGTKMNSNSLYLIFFIVKMATIRTPH